MGRSIDGKYVGVYIEIDLHEDEIQEAFDKESSPEYDSLYEFWCKYNFETGEGVPGNVCLDYDFCLEDELTEQKLIDAKLFYKSKRKSTIEVLQAILGRENVEIVCGIIDYWYEIA